MKSGAILQQIIVSVGGTWQSHGFVLLNKPQPSTFSAILACENFRLFMLAATAAVENFLKYFFFSFIVNLDSLRGVVVLRQVSTATATKHTLVADGRMH